MNKKGEKLLSIWWFAILAIVGVSIVIGTIAFYSAEVDVRKIESSILAEKIFDCVSDNGILKKEFYEAMGYTKNNCGLSDVIYEEGSNYYYEIKVSLEGVEVREKERFGDGALETNCYIAQESEGEHLPQCTFLEKHVVYEGKNYVINILAASNNNGRRITINE